MNTYLRKKIEERASQSKVLQSLQDQAATEGRDLTEAERKTFDDIVRRLQELDAEVERIKQFDEGAAKFAALVGAQAEAEEQAQRAHQQADDDAQEKQPQQRAAVMDFGARFVESAAFKNYRGAGTSERMTLPGPASPEFRAAITTGSVGLTAYTGPVPELWGGNAVPTFTNRILAVCGRVATSQSAVLYLTWTPQPPGNAPTVAEGDLKTEAVMDVAEATIALQTYAHWKAITRQALEDIPQVQTIVQNRLLQGVASALEAAAVASLVAATLPAATGPDMLGAIRVGIAEVEANGYTPNAVVLNPADAATIDTESMGNTNNGAVRAGQVWGLPVIPANSVAAGTVYVGAMNQGLTWFDRGNTDVYMSDSHADFFLRNQLVILAEARAAFAVTEAAAIAEVTVTPPVGG